MTLARAKILQLILGSPFHQLHFLEWILEQPKSTSFPSKHFLGRFSEEESLLSFLENKSIYYLLPISSALESLPSRTKSFVEFLNEFKLVEFLILTLLHPIFCQKNQNFIDISNSVAIQIMLKQIMKFKPFPETVLSILITSEENANQILVDHILEYPDLHPNLSQKFFQILIDSMFQVDSISNLGKLRSKAKALKESTPTI